MNFLIKMLCGNPYEKWENKKYESLTLKEKSNLKRILDKELVHMGENGKNLVKKVREEKKEARYLFL